MVTILAERLGPTFLLGVLTLLIDFTVGLALGVWSALHPDTHSRAAHRRGDDHRIRAAVVRDRDAAGVDLRGEAGLVPARRRE